MNRNIKSEKVYRLVILPGSEEKIDLEEGILQSREEFDEKGNLCLEINYGADGSVTEKNIFTYDTLGRLASTVIYGDEDEVLETRVHTWNDQGLLESEQIRYLDGSTDTVRYSYKDGLAVEKVQVTDDEEVEMREVYEYQDARLVLFERYDSDGELIHQARNTFSEGRLVQTDISSSENDEPFTQVIRYNAAGRRIEDMKYDAEGRLIERNRSEEDETGRVVRLVEENTFRSHTTGLEYDDAGRLVRQVEKDLHGNLVSDVERTYTEEGLPESAHITVRDRSTGTYQQYYLIYEYEFFEEVS